MLKFIVEVLAIVVTALFPILGYLLIRRARAKRARLLAAIPTAPQAQAPAPATAAAPAPTAPAPAPTYAPPPISAGGPPSLGRAFIFILLFLFALAVLGGGGAYLYFQHKGSVSKAEAMADPCAKCTVEKIPNEQLTCEQHGNKWRFLGHKCIGSEGCASCKVANCESAEMEVPPPADGCDRCSKSGD